MKKIIIFLLLVIVSIMGYDQYKKYKRFSPPEYEYEINNKIDLEYHNQAFVLDYYEAIESLNGCVISQWSVNDIDVRNPKKDNKTTQVATAEYAKKLGKVKFYESKLVKSATLKNEGLDNYDIKNLEEKGLSNKDSSITSNIKSEHITDKKIKSLIETEFLRKNIRLGEASSIVYEIQKILVKKGYEIPVDGVFKNVTSEALKSFQEKNNLYPDGKLDAITLEYLLE